MSVSIIALNYIWYHYQSKFYNCDKGGFDLTVEQMKDEFRKDYNVKSIYELTQKQVNEDFEKRSHIGGKYIFFKEDYLSNDWGKDVSV